MEIHSRSFLEGLSNELLANVFVHLDFKSALCFSHVNKQFNAFASDDTIWKYLYAFNYMQTNHNITIQTNLNLTWRELCNKISLYQEWQCVGTDELTDEVWQAHFSPCGKMLAVSGRSGELRIYNVQIQTQKDGRQSVKVRHMHTFLPSDLGMEAIGHQNWSPDSTKLLVSDRKARCVILDVKHKVILHEFRRSTDTSPTFLTNDQIVTTSSRRTIDLVQECADGSYKTTHRKVIKSIDDPYFNILSPDCKYIAMRFNNDNICLLDAVFTDDDILPDNIMKLPKSSYDTFKTFDTAHRYHLGFCFSQDDSYLVINLRERDQQGVPRIITELWDIDTVTKISYWNTGICEPDFLVFPIMVRGNAFIISGSEDGCVSIVHTQSKELLHQFKAHGDIVNHVALHPELDLLVSVSDTNEIKFWTPSKSNIDCLFES